MLTYARLTDLLDYDEETGVFSWRLRHGKGQEDEPAGYLHRSGAYVITIDGEKYRAPRLAWFYATGDWPIGQIRALDGDQANTAFANLRDTMHPDDNSPAAERGRQRRLARQEAAEAAERRKELLHRTGFSPVKGVKQAPNGQWIVTDPQRPTRERGRFGTVEEAEAFQRAFQLTVEYIDRHRPLMPSATHAITAGPNGLSLYEAHHAFCYHPTRGHIYYRAPERKGWRADHLNKDGRPVVTYGPRHYPAPMLAWFLTHGQWPPRKSIRHRNGKPADFRLSNLELRT